MDNNERQTGIMEGTEGVLDNVDSLSLLADDDLEDVIGGGTKAPTSNAVGMSVYAYYNGRWWPGVITVATAGNPPLYTVTGYNSNGTKWGLVCTIKELRKRH